MHYLAMRVADIPPGLGSTITRHLTGDVDSSDTDHYHAPKTASNPITFLSEIVQYWTAIYPELADHQKVHSTLKPILPRACDYLKETIMRNKYAGKGKPIEGAVKDKAGEMINDHDLEAKGKAEFPDRKIQEKAGKARWKAGKVIMKAGRIISGRRLNRNHRPTI